MSTTNVTNLALNKKGTKVKVVGKPRIYSTLGMSAQWLPSLAYLAVKFDLFTFQNSGYAITGWGAVFIITLFLAFRQRIKDKFKEYEETFGSAWNRAKSGNISLGIASILLLVSVFSTSLFIIFYIFAISTYASLAFYKPYDILNKKRLEMQKLLDQKRQTEDFQTLTEQFNQINT